MSKELLFIGGPADGKRITVGDVHQSVAIPSREPDGLKKNYYNRKRFRDGSREFDAMVYAEMPDDSVMEQLLNGYRVPALGAGEVTTLHAREESTGLIEKWRKEAEEIWKTATGIEKSEGVASMRTMEMRGRAVQLLDCIKDLKMRIW